MKKTLGSYDDIVIVPYGMWSEKAVLSFSQDGNAGSRITAGSGETINVDTIDNMCFEDKVTFIKMDIEGSEQNALRGAVNVIKKDKPRLAVCVYHSLEDLYEIPFWIKETVPEYKLYIRHHSDNECETVVYATI